MKKCLLLIMTFTLILSSIAPVGVYAQEDMDRQLESTILKVKELFNISDDYDGFNSRVSSYDDKIIFYLNWSDSKEKLPNINVSVDADNNISSYNKFYRNSGEQETKLPNISIEKGKDIALEFIKKVDSSLVSQIVLKEDSDLSNYQEQEYNFIFFRQVNNIPYYSNTLRINVDKYTGEVTNYHADWDRDLKFPDATKAISYEKGKKAFKDNIGLDLVYKKSNVITFKLPNSKEETNYFLTYSTADGNAAIDAITGNKIDLNYYGYGVYNIRNADGAGESEKAITPEERAEIDKVSGIKNIGEIEKIARAALDIGADYKLKSKNIYSNWRNSSELQWSLYFEKELRKDNMITADISLDAKTGEIISFYHRIDQEDKKPTINMDQALELANSCLEKLTPDEKDRVEYLPEESGKDERKTYTFRFIRKEGDIYVEDDGIYIGVDTVNNRIYSYSKDWDKKELPPVGKIISFDKAYDILFNDIGYELMYVSVYDQNAKDERQVKLVYNIKPEKPLNISASNGEILDFRGRPFKESKVITYKDIDNSYAKDKIKTLAQYGIAFDAEEFRPKDKILQKDFMYLVWKSINSYRIYDKDEVDAIYKDLMNQNIIREGEKAPDSYVTKEDGVKYIIRAMRYDKIAEIDGIYKEIFADTKDISKELKGHMILAYGLGIIKGDGKEIPNINPKYELKREDAINIIYNYVFN